MSGWIKLYRQIQNSPIYDDSKLFHLAVHLLLEASHDEHQGFWQGKVIKLQPGQFTAGSFQICLATGLSSREFRTRLSKLEKLDFIDRQTSNLTSLYTIKKWADYQKIDNQTTGKRQASDKQTTTLQELKNGELKNNRGVFTPPSLVEAVDFFGTIGGDPGEAAKFADHYQATGWKTTGGAKIVDWKAAARKWVRTANNSHNPGSRMQKQAEAKPQEPEKLAEDALRLEILVSGIQPAQATDSDKLQACLRLMKKHQRGEVFDGLKVWEQTFRERIKSGGSK